MHSADRVDGRIEALHGAVQIGAASGGSIDLTIDDGRRTYRIVSDGNHCYVHSALGTSTLIEVPRFPLAQSEEVAGGCRAPMPGKILAVRIAAGDAVTKGQVLVILEAMKMEHEVVAPSDGTVESVSAEVGQQVEAGTVLVTLQTAESQTP